MPFGGYFDSYYVDVFCPAIEAAGLKACRADDLYRPSAIVNDIWSYTKNARIILADLTGKNPNVFYELGLAHALAKPAILVTESLEDIPFDLRGLRIIQYDKNDPAWGSLLKDKIKASIKEILQSPESAVLPTFLDVNTTAPKPSLTPQEKEVIQLKQDLNMLQRELTNIRDVRIGRSVSAPESTTLRRVHSSDEADQLIRELMELKVPKSMIEQHVTESGAPKDWTRRRVKEIMAEKTANNSRK